MQNQPHLYSRYSIFHGQSVIAWMLIAWVLGMTSTNSDADSPEFSPAVVEKADKILADAGLRRNGKNIQSTQTSILARTITKLSKQKRELRKLRQEWEVVDQLTDQNKAQIRRMTIQDGNLNLEMARVAGRNVSESNRLVGLINANRARTLLLRESGIQLKKQADQKRVVLTDAETQYAESAIGLQKSFEEIEKRINESLAEPDVQTAIQVMSRNFEILEEQTASLVLKVLGKKIKKIQQAIFREAIPLQVEQGSLYVDVVVGEESIRMVVDSGATLVSLPADAAAKLGIQVPPDAPRLRLVMADGNSIEARKVTLERVRIGNFEATGVEAAVLERSAIRADPLLGLSYLGNFKFEIDIAAKQLKMLRISAE